jgi:hypothetical protein
LTGRNMYLEAIIVSFFHRLSMRSGDKESQIRNRVLGQDDLQSRAYCQILPRLNIIDVSWGMQSGVKRRSCLYDTG